MILTLNMSAVKYYKNSEFNKALPIFNEHPIYKGTNKSEEIAFILLFSLFYW